MSEEVSTDLPYRGEYAKSGRSSCKACKNTIDKGELRLAIMVQSPMFDGKVPNWHHVKCFFQRQRPKMVGDIEHFDSLRWEDQEKLRKLVASALAGKGPSGGKASGGVSASGTVMKDFRIEVAKASGAGCRVCEEKIKKGLPRIGKKDYDSQRAKMYGPYDRWHHVECFAKKREELEFFDAGEKLAGFKTISADDQELVKNNLPALKRKATEKTGSEPAVKKAKSSKESKEDEQQRAELGKQMKKIYYYRDMLERHFAKKDLEELLTFNDQEIPSGVDRMLDRLSDNMMFGALLPCTECGEGQLVFRSGIGYACTGNISEWTKCQFKTDTPKRKAFKLPAEFKRAYDFCKLYKYKEKTRIIPKTETSVSSQSSNGNTEANGKISPLKNLTFVLDGDFKPDFQEKLEALGAKIGKKVTDKTAAVICAEALPTNAKEYTTAVKGAKKHGIDVVSTNFLEGILTNGIVANIKANCICDWPSDVKERLGPQLLATSGLTKTGKSLNASSNAQDVFAKDMPKSMKLKLKGGAYVDPESGLDNKAHVYQKGDALYSVVLGVVNISTGMNSYYKLQLLEHDKKKKFYIFRSWGRVGTTIGGSKVESFDSKSDAMGNFEYLYEEKTGNAWRDRNNFEKKAGKFYPLDIDMGQDSEEIKKLEVKGSNSKLALPIQELVQLVFDIESMKRTMVEFEIDLRKMPMGKLSRKQIETAYQILSEAHKMVKDKNGSETKFLDASNRFFTLIPHDFGMNKPPILDNEDYIKSKLDMLDNLLEIEVAYTLLQKIGSDSKEMDPIDAHYAKLNTNIEVLDRASDEFKTLEKYVQNTHGATHNMYSLEIEQIFKVARKGEYERFKRFESMSNRMLLWHGSRTTNFAGILSQGLRIAPPEAPVTGYMFGKGIYFADMVSKSANYCCTSTGNTTGLLLLCDVALGNMYERTQAEYVEKLPKGKNSTKGVGKTEPNPKLYSELDGAKVPYGKGVNSGVSNTSLLYNEYIVYDVAQCNAKYLFRMKFNYNY